MPKCLRLILGDQLNYEHQWFNRVSVDTLYVMMEIRQETDYVHHHIQKVAGFFAAMRSFCKIMEEKGHRFIYLKLNDPENTQDLPSNLFNLILRTRAKKFEYQLPDEYRLDHQLKEFSRQLSIPHQVYDSEHFLNDRGAVGRFFKGKKQFLMESFYRDMRKKYKILMNEDQPLGGKWNLDELNRNKYNGKAAIPPDPPVRNNVEDIHRMITEQKIDTIGAIDPENFIWPINRKQSIQVLDHFIKSGLPHFGTYQDAMFSKHPFLFHSRLSFALNTKMLHPLEVVNKVIQEYRIQPEKINLAQVEGFIRQIIGWREYMRGIYWEKMPEYADLNFFNHSRPLPDYFWSGNTKMNCMSHAIGQSLQWAYAHHIQRLMITGNFALLAGINPVEVDLWYLGIYIDAIEWVEITNTRGMSQFADGGIVGTKPYVSSANYINKMSNYCGSCFYNQKQKYGIKACPYNSLYWNFFQKQRSKLEKNPRIGMVYRLWDKIESEEKNRILKQAELYLENLNEL
jgi:deoxyribodipyrimidine photolyase-related protein